MKLTSINSYATIQVSNDSDIEKILNQASIEDLDISKADGYFRELELSITGVTFTFDGTRDFTIDSVERFEQLIEKLEADFTIKLEDKNDSWRTVVLTSIEDEYWTMELAVELY